MNMIQCIKQGDRANKIWEGTLYKITTARGDGKREMKQGIRVKAAEIQDGMKGGETERNSKTSSSACEGKNARMLAKADKME